MQFPHRIGRITDELKAFPLEWPCAGLQQGQSLDLSMMATLLGLTNEMDFPVPSDPRSCGQGIEVPRWEMPGDDHALLNQTLGIVEGRQ